MPALDPTMIARAIEALEAGEIVCYPTESTYGLAVDLGRPASLDRLAQLKARPSREPFGLVVADRAMARRVASSWPAEAERLASLYWPGPLTLVVPAVEGTPPHVIGPHGVGLRVSSHPVAHALAAGLGRPITATSANRSSRPPAVVVDEARRELGDAVAVYLDGGVCAGTPSTVVAITADGTLELIRSGALVLPGVRRV